MFIRPATMSGELYIDKERMRGLFMIWLVKEDHRSAFLDLMLAGTVLPRLDGVELKKVCILSLGEVQVNNELHHATLRSAILASV
jgi:hypothetical protein